MEALNFNLPKNKNKIKIFGIGQGGISVATQLYSSDIKNVEISLITTDSRELKNNSIKSKLLIGQKLTKGLGSGSNPKTGRMSVIDSKDEIEKLIDDETDVLILLAGLGGGTGTGSIEPISKIAKKKNILTIAIVSTPFSFEGQQRNKQALIALDNFKNTVDSIIVIDSNKLKKNYDSIGFKTGFIKLNEIMSNVVIGLLNILNANGNINIDTTDLKTIFKNSKYSTITFATAKGIDRAKSVIIKAFKNPLLENYDLSKTKNVILNIGSGKSEVTIDEIGIINDYITQNTSENLNIIMGVYEDSNLGDNIEVQIIIAGFELDDSLAEDRLINQTLELSKKDTLTLYLLEEEYTTSDISELISFISDLYREIGGDSLVIKGMEILEVESVLEPVM